MTVAERLDAEAQRRSDTALRMAPLSAEHRATPEELDEMRFRIAWLMAINADARERAEIAASRRICTI